MEEIDLKLRLTWPDEVKDDYHVIWTSERWGEWRVGRIRYAGERDSNTGDNWDWSITIPLPQTSDMRGREVEFSDATKAFRKAFERFLERATEMDLQHGYDVQRAGETRLKMMKR